jgi:hypothetical protein
MSKKYVARDPFHDSATVACIETHANGNDAVVFERVIRPSLDLCTFCGKGLLHNDMERNNGDWVRVRPARPTAGSFLICCPVCAESLFRASYRPEPVKVTRKPKARRTVKKPAKKAAATKKRTGK